MGALRRLMRQRIADRYVRMLLRAYEFSSTIMPTLSISCGDLFNVNSIKYLPVLMNGTRDFLFVSETYKHNDTRIHAPGCDFFFNYYIF